MKLVLLFLISIFFQIAHAEWSINEFWDQDNSPALKIVCNANDDLCTDLCGKNNNCNIKQVVCRDCIGTSILMTNIFEGMGIQYRSTNENVLDSEFTDFIKRGMYVTFSSKSIYNQTDSYDSESLREKFLSLCPLETQNSLVFFSLKDSTNILDEVKYVVCDNHISRMSDNPDIVLNENSLPPMNFKIQIF